MQDRQLFHPEKALLVRIFSVLQKERRFLANLVFQRKDIQNNISTKLQNFDQQKIYEAEIKSRKNSNDFLKLFYHIKENQTIYNAYFKLGASFTEKEVHYDYTLAEKYFDNKYIDYHIEFFYKGLNAILIKWLNSGCKESPEEIENIIKTEYQGRKL